jgi:integrase
VQTVRRKHKEVIQENEVESFLLSISRLRDYALVAFAVASGCRRGEILALETTDINFATGEVSINKSLEETRAGPKVKSTKSEKPRTLALPGWLLPILRQQLQLIGSDKALLGSSYRDESLLFPRRDGTHESPDKVGRRIQSSAQKSWPSHDPSRPTALQCELDVEQ